MKIRELILAGLFAALTCVGAFITIPIGPVPITFQVLFTFIAGALLGKKIGALSQLVYVLLGMIGLPVFAGGNSGIGAITGPTGGFIIGFILAAYVIGIIVEGLEKSANTITKKVAMYALSMLSGLLVIDGFGVLRLATFVGSISKALTLGFYPFIIFDFIKMGLAILVVLILKKQLVKAGLLNV